MEKKVIIVSHDGYKALGGVPRVMETISGILKESGYDVFCLSEENLKNPILILWKKFFKNTGYHIVNSIFQSIWLWKHAKSEFVISNGFYACFFKSEMLIFHGVNDALKNSLRECWFRRAFSMTSFLEKVALKNAKTIVAVSEFVKDDLIHYYKISASKIHILENIVDMNIFYPNPVYYFRKNIIYSGVINNAKGSEMLKSIINEINQTNDYTIRLVVPSVEFSQLTENVIFSTAKNSLEMANYFRESSVLFFPSKYEGFSLVTLEAISCGIPVVFTQNDAGFVKHWKHTFPDAIHVLDSNLSILAQIEAFCENYTDEKREKVLQKCRQLNDKKYYSESLITFLKEK